MGTQVPKGLAIGMMLVGVPLILWDASRTSDELNALDRQSSSREARVEACMTKTAGLGVDPSKHLEMCGCVVDKAAERGLTERYGNYDEEGLEQVVNSCVWQLGL